MREVVKNSDPRWLGETVVCIASGPSLTREDVDAIRELHDRGHCRVVVVNREYASAPWADALYMADYRCWDEYIKDVREVFTGELWTIDVQAARTFKLNLLRRGAGQGYSTEPRTLNTGGNSGYQAIHLAAFWGAKRIALLGYDMQLTDGKAHHYGTHRGKLPNGKGFAAWIPRFAPLIKDLTHMGVEVVNMTRVTAIPKAIIPRSSIEEFAW